MTGLDSLLGFYGGEPLLWEPNVTGRVIGDDAHPSQPDVTDIHELGAVEAARLIAGGELSSVELLDALVERIERLDSPLNLVVTLDEERARQAALLADAGVVAGDDLGPLHGVPMTIKDSFMTEGLRTTCGAPEYASFVPDVDAVPVARLKEAGAIIFGKTNLPIWAGDGQSYNEVFGTSSSPWDHSRTPGGSSGGSAGALAARFTPLELGSDIAGSIRAPAAWSGVVGHKPSYGIVPFQGQIPGAPGTLTQADLSVTGPMARSVEDCEVALDVLAGPSLWDAAAWRLELPRRRTGALRVAVWADDAACPVESEIAEAVVAAGDALAMDGMAVDHEARPEIDFGYARRVFEQLLGAALSPGWSHEQIEGFATRERSEPGFAVEGGLGAPDITLRHRAWLSANERRLQMRRRWASFFESWDVVLMPTMPCSAIEHDHSEPLSRRTFRVNGEERPYSDLSAWNGVIGVASLPATVVPLGLDSGGMPIGVQVAGPYLEDRTTLAVAGRLLDLYGGVPAPPGL